MSKGFGVTEEAIAKLEAMASSMEETSQKIHQETAKLESVFQENESGLGAHSAEIQALIEEVKRTEEDATVPVTKLVLRLRKAAMIRREHLNNSRYHR